jgi:hypothetical protein
MNTSRRRVAAEMAQRRQAGAGAQEQVPQELTLPVQLPPVETAPGAAARERVVAAAQAAVGAEALEECPAAR